MNEIIFIVNEPPEGGYVATHRGMRVPRDLSGADLRKALGVLGYEETRHERLRHGAAEPQPNLGHHQ
jgi:hypothetical protein